MKNNIFKKFDDFITKSYNIIISGHENPDPDSICSCLALEYLLYKLDKNVIFLSSENVAANIKAFDYRNIIKDLDYVVNIKNISEYSMILLDTNDMENLDKIKKPIIDIVKTHFFIDHHSFNGKNKDDYLINTMASSTCEIIYTLYEHYKIKIPKEIGNALFAGILFDTGSFHYPKTSYLTFNIASKLVKNGTNPNDIYLSLFENEPIESIKILPLVISTLEFHYDEKIAIITLSKEMLEKTGAKYEDTAYIINLPLKSSKVLACIYFKENTNGVKRVSMRTKGDIDVAGLSIKLFNGGGHKNAAGFKINKPYNEFNDIKEIIINKIIEEIKKSK